MATTVSQSYAVRSHIARPGATPHCAECDENDAAVRSSLVSRARERFSSARHSALTTPASRQSLTLAALDNPLYSKVDEVRRKLEERATSDNFSRSFESPPRRRLAESLFASFKLPRRRSETNMAMSRVVPQSTPLHSQSNGLKNEHRKSAVEILAESKAFYVKSEAVLDRKQQLPIRVVTSQSNTTSANSSYGSGNTNGVLSGGVECEGLNRALRHLLSSNESRRRADDTNGLVHSQYSSPRIGDAKVEYSGRQKRLTSIFKSCNDDQYDQTTNRVKDLARSLPVNQYESIDRRYYCRDMYNYDRDTIKSRRSFIGKKEKLKLSPTELTLDFTPGRGYKNDMTKVSPTERSGNMTSRRTYTAKNDLSKLSPTEVTVELKTSRAGDANVNRRSYFDDNRLVPDILDMSPNDMKKLHRASSHGYTDDDSGYYRRDSRGTNYYETKETYSHKDGFHEAEHAVYPQRIAQNYHSFDESFGMDVGTISPPEQYSYKRYEEEEPNNINSHKSLPDLHTHNSSKSHCTSSSSRANSISRASYVSSSCGAFSERRHPNNDNGTSCWCECGGSSGGRRTHHSAPHPYRNDAMESWISAEYQPPPQFQDDPTGYSNRCYDQKQHEDHHIEKAKPEVSQPAVGPTSPLGEFKRQRCLRFKHRKGRPILRSKSDTSDRYVTTASGNNTNAELERFFNRMGLDDETYRALELSNDGTPSGSLPSTRGSPQPGQPCPPSPPKKTPGPREPGVVERNARVIKWLCQCKKAMANI